MSAPLARVPCTIVTGFLGSGKTTLIRHVLANANGRRLAVIVNEFGDVGIDGEILKGCGDAACPEETSSSSPMAASAARWRTSSCPRSI
jgi:cobalamin biosynthesis protein CobW